MHLKELKLRMSYRHKNHDKIPFFSILKNFGQNDICSDPLWTYFGLCRTLLKLGKLDFSIVLGNNSDHLVDDDFDDC